MRKTLWITLAGVIFVYFGMVDIFGFAGPIALGLHFLRIVLTISALVIYVQMAPHIFKEVPPPRRDYLLLGINFMLLSAVCFAFWNEASRVWGFNNDVFNNPVSGLFSLLLCIGAIFALIAPDTEGDKPRVIALIIGVVLSIGLVFIAPMFRPS